MGFKLHPVLRYRRHLARKKLRQHDRLIHHSQKMADNFGYRTQASTSYRAAAREQMRFRDEVAAEDRRLTKLIGE